MATVTEKQSVSDQIPSSRPEFLSQLSVKIGEGSFGACYQYRDVHTQEMRVKKKMRLLDGDAASGQQQHLCGEVLREIATHHALSRTAATCSTLSTLQEMQRTIRFSPRIQYLADLHTIQVENMTFLPKTLTEYIKGTLLHERLKAMPIIFRDIVLGLVTLHGHVTSHGDLSASNILLQMHDDKSVESACLSDFGSVVLEPQPTTVQCCTWWFRAPELSLRAQDQFDIPSPSQPFVGRMTTQHDIPASSVFGPWNDMWSVGAILALFVFGRSPFHGSPIHREHPTNSMKGEPAVDEWSCRQLVHAPSPFPTLSIRLAHVLRDAGYGDEIVSGWIQLQDQLLCADLTRRMTSNEALLQLNQLLELHNSHNNRSNNTDQIDHTQAISSTSSHLSRMKEHISPSIGWSDTQWRQCHGVELPQCAQRLYEKHLPELLITTRNARWMELIPLTISIYRRWLLRWTFRRFPVAADHRTATMTTKYDLRASGDSLTACLYLAGVHFDKGSSVYDRCAIQKKLTVPQLTDIALAVCRDLDFDLIRPTLYGLLSSRQRGSLPVYLIEIMIYLSIEPTFILASPSWLFNMYVRSFEAASLIPSFSITPLWLSISIPLRADKDITDSNGVVQLRTYVQRLHYWLSRITIESDRKLIIHHLCCLLYERSQSWRYNADLCKTCLVPVLTYVLDRFQSDEARRLLQRIESLAIMK